MIVQIVKFTSELSEEEVVETYQQRAPRFRALDGLVQKLYLRFPATEEYGAVYLWRSQEDLAAFRASELAQTIAEAYHVKGAPDIQVAELVMPLRESQPVP